MKIKVFALLTVAAVALLCACGGSDSEPQPGGQRTLHNLDKPFVGVSAFGILSENYQGEVCDQLLGILSRVKRPAIALLFGSFGNNPGCLFRAMDQAAAEDKPLLIEIHFAKEVGREKKDLVAPDFLPAVSHETITKLYCGMQKETEGAVARRVNQILQIVRPDPNIKYILSSGLENRFSDCAAQNILTTLKKYWPYEIADNPQNNKDRAPAGVYSEKHNYLARSAGHCIVNGDGQDVDFLEARPFSAWLPHANREQVSEWFKWNILGGCTAFFWHAEGQGIDGYQKTPTLERTFRIRPNDALTIGEMLIDAEKFYKE